MHSKPWYKSKTLIGIAAAAIAGATGASTEAASELVTHALDLIEIGGLLLAAYGRAKAEGPIRGR